MRLEHSIDVFAGPWRVWDLVSTSWGLSSWFVAAEVVPGVAGSVTLRFGPGAEGTMPIRCWEPPRRIRFGAPEGAAGRAHEFELTATPAGATVVRVTDIGLEESQVDHAREGWALYLDQLRAQLDTP